MEYSVPVALHLDLLVFVVEIAIVGKERLGEPQLLWLKCLKIGLLTVVIEWYIVVYHFDHLMSSFVSFLYLGTFVTISNINYVFFPLFKDK